MAYSARESICFEVTKELYFNGDYWRQNPTVVAICREVANRLYDVLDAQLTQDDMKFMLRSSYLQYRVPLSPENLTVFEEQWQMMCGERSGNGSATKSSGNETGVGVANTTSETTPTVPTPDSLQQAQEIIRAHAQQNRGASLRRYKIIHTLARKLMPILPSDFDVTRLRSAMKDLCAAFRDAGHPAFALEADDEDKLIELEKYFDTVKVPFGSNRWERAVQQAQTDPLEFDLELGLKADCIQVASVAYYLQKNRPNADIMLPVGKVAQLLGKDEKRASRVLYILQKRGIVQVTDNTYALGRPKRYRFVMDSGKYRLRVWRLKMPHSEGASKGEKGTM